MSGLSGRVLITGSGTLARAILRQARREGWQATFTIFARSESRLAALRLAYPGIRTIIGDVRDVMLWGWDLLAVFHPPCTRLCNSGVRWLHTDRKSVV